MGSSKRLVWIVCRGRCGGDQPARLAKEEGPHLQLGSADGPLHGYVAYCLNCGYRATDHGNWRRCASAVGF